MKSSTSSCNKKNVLNESSINISIMNAPKTPDQLYGFTDYMNPARGIPNDDDQNYQQSAMQVMRIDSMMNELVNLGDMHGNRPHFGGRLSGCHNGERRILL